MWLKIRFSVPINNELAPCSIIVEHHERAPPLASTAGGAPPRRTGAAPHLGGIGTFAPGRTVLLSSIRRCFAL
jgi:hypothetical protein